MKNIKEKLETPLSPSEKLQAKTLMDNLNSKDAEKNKEAIQYLQQTKNGVIIRLALRSSFFRKFFTEDERIQNKWEKELRDEYGPSIPLKGTKPKEYHSLFENYLGNYLVGLFRVATESPNEPAKVRAVLLEDACKLGSFKALRARCMINLRVLHRPHTDHKAEHNERRSTQILTDSLRLANLYGAPGYLAAGLIIDMLAGYYRKSGDETLIERAKVLREAAVVDFLCAWRLREDKYSNELLMSLTHGQGMHYLMHKDTQAQFKTWDVALETFKDWVGKDTFEVLLQRSKQLLADRIEEKSNNSSSNSSTATLGK